MGIRYLNKFLRNECSDIIKVIHMNELYGKKIAVDISIYMYKFASENKLIENIYLMLTIFRYYNIIPIFIFDGKPPAEKNIVLKERKESKREAEKEYNALKEKIDNDCSITEFDKQDMIAEMDSLKKQFIYITKDMISQVKHLIRSYGVTYVDAPNEADELCSYLMLKNKVYACLSEDMDMFVYGCKRILRYFSLLNHTAIIYDMDNILKKLNITHDELREICVLSGTDYNKINENQMHLFKILKLFKKYNEIKHSNPNLKFYVWLLENTKYINNYSDLIKINNMFDLLANEKQNLKLFDSLKIMNRQIIFKDIKEILKNDGFIFP